MQDDKLNFSRYAIENWKGLTKDEAAKKVSDLFGESVYYTFATTQRFTEELYTNYITFIVHNDIVMNSYWG